jgi:hypothetical protein
MIKAAIALAGAISVIEIATASADSYPDSFADYLNAHGLYFEYLSAAEDALWFKTSAGDIVLRMPEAVAPNVSIKFAETPPLDLEVAGLRSDLDLAMSSALGRLGIRQCASDGQAPCIPFALQLGFASQHGDMVRLPDLRDSLGGQLTGMPNGSFGSHDRAYGMACGTNVETSRGKLSRMDAGFTLEAIPSGGQQALTSGMEECLLGMLGVHLPQGLPRGDIEYYVARSLEAMHKAETFLTHDQTAGDTPGLVMTHALRKALGKEPTVGQ